MKRPIPSTKELLTLPPERVAIAQFLVRTILPRSHELVELLIDPVLRESQAADVRTYVRDMRRFLDALELKVDGRGEREGS